MSAPLAATRRGRVPSVAADVRTVAAAVVWRDTHQGGGGAQVIDIVLRQMRRCGNGNVDPGEECDDGNARRR